MIVQVRTSRNIGHQSPENKDIKLCSTSESILKPLEVEQETSTSGPINARLSSKTSSGPTRSLGPANMVKLVDPTG